MARQLRQMIVWVLVVTMALGSGPATVLATPPESPPPPEEPDPEPCDPCPCPPDNPPDEDDDEDEDDNGGSGSEGKGGGGGWPPDEPDEPDQPGPSPTPECDEAPPGCTLYPIYQRYGSVIEREVDLRLTGPSFAWEHTRTYNSQGDYLSRTTTQGNGWDNNNGGMYLATEGSEVVVYRSAASAMRFVEATVSPSSSQYPPGQSGSNGTLYRPQGSTTGANATRLGFDVDLVKFTATDTEDYDKDGDEDESIELYKLTEFRTSRVYYFCGMGGTIAAGYDGKLVEATSRHLDGSSTSGARYSYTTSGTLSQITSPEGQDYNIVYTHSSGNVTKIEVKRGTTVIAQVDYTYRDSGHLTDLGAIGDLIQVKVSKADSDGSLSIVDYTQYRYDPDSRLEAVFDNDAIERVLADDATASSPDDLLTWEDTDDTSGVLTSTGHNLLHFATKRFEYYTANVATDSITTKFKVDEDLEDRYGAQNTAEIGRVKKEIVGPGGCSSCGAGSGIGVTYEYYYLQLNGGASTDWNEVVWLVVEDKIDADGVGVPVSRRVTAQNDTGRTLRDVTILDPTTGSPKYWCTSIVYSTAASEPGRIAEQRSVSAHNDKVVLPEDLEKFLNPTFGTNDNDTLDDHGVIESFEYNARGRRKATLMRNGKSGTRYYTSYRVYGDNSANKPDWLPVEERAYSTKVLADPDQNGQVTKYEYTFWDGGSSRYTQVKTKKTTLPVVPTSQNGSGVATVMWEYWDEEGRLRWEKDGEGYVHYTSYHPKTGGVALRVTDINTGSLPGDVIDTGSGKWVASGAVPSGFTREGGLPDALNLIAKQEFDDLGRYTMATDTGGGRHYTRYKNDQVVLYRYVDATSGLPLLPVEVIDYKAGRAVERRRLVATAATGSDGTPTGFSTSSQADYTHWTRWAYDPLTGQLTQTDRYHAIPDTGSGTTYGSLGTNYYRDHLYYDARGNVGAIARFVDTARYSGDTDRYQVAAQLYDRIDRWTERRIGVASAAPADYATLTATIGGTPPTNFSGWANVWEREYDDGGVGDGRLTSYKRHHTATDYSQFNLHRDWMGNLRAVERLKNGTTVVKPHRVFDVDWPGRVVASALVKTDITNFATTVVADEDYAQNGPSATDRVSLALTSYDDLGRAFRRDVRRANANRYQRVDGYYDRRGFLVAVGDPYSAPTERAFDGAGRFYQQRVVKELTAALPATPYLIGGAFDYAAPEPDPDFTEMTGDNGGVIELTHLGLVASGNAEARHRVELNHNDSNGFGLSSGTPSGGVRATRHYEHDGADRLTTIIDHGSGASTWKSAALPSRVSPAPTASTASYLVTRFGYDTAGRRDSVIDPKPLAASPFDRTTRSFFDDLNRARFVVENHQGSYDPATAPPTGAADVNRTTGVVLNGLGRVSELNAFNAGATPATQTTHYWYEDNYNAGLVTEAAYPDSSSTPASGSGSDLIVLTYNQDGSRVTRTDQRGVRITYGYDDARRVELQSASVTSGTFASLNVDNAVLAIGRTYDDFGRLELVTSHSGTTAGSGVVNQVEYSYNSDGVVSKSEQSHSGAVGSGTPAAIYTYDTDVASGTSLYRDGLRLTQTTLPAVSSNGRINRYYGSGGTLDDLLHREYFVKLHDGGLRSGTHAHAVRNERNGVGRVVRTLSESGSNGVNAVLDHHGSGGDYTALDRWGRVTRQEWTLAGATVDEFEYAYDEASNRTKRDVVGQSSLDQDYTHDELHRLESVDEAATAEDQSWDLDQLGNWETFTDGGVAQARTHNGANELETIAVWANPQHDAAGNMTAFPNANDLQFTHHEAEYDAWNRLTKVSLVASGSAVDASTYEYDGLGRRVKRTEGTTTPVTTHFYYNERWQVLSETDGSGTPTAVYLHHPHYVDALAVRMTSTDHSNGESEHFFTHDALFNVTSAIVDDTTDSVVERYTYHAYGQRRVMSDTYGALSSSAIGNDFGFTGRRVDPSTGLQINRFRYYHPRMGRWTQRDPIGYSGEDTSLYGYVGSLPTNYLDPFGLCPTSKTYPQGPSNANDLLKGMRNMAGLGPTRADLTKGRNLGRPEKLPHTSAKFPGGNGGRTRAMQGEGRGQANGSGNPPFIGTNGTSTCIGCIIITDKGTFAGHFDGGGGSDRPIDGFMRDYGGGKPPRGYIFGGNDSPTSNSLLSDVIDNMEDNGINWHYLNSDGLWAGPDGVQACQDDNDADSDGE